MFDMRTVLIDQIPAAKRQKFFVSKLPAMVEMTQVILSAILNFSTINGKLRVQVGSVEDIVREPGVIRFAFGVRVPYTISTDGSKRSNVDFRISHFTPFKFIQIYELEKATR